MDGGRDPDAPVAVPCGEGPGFDVTYNPGPGVLGGPWQEGASDESIVASGTVTESSPMGLTIETDSGPLSIAVTLPGGAAQVVSRGTLATVEICSVSADHGGFQTTVVRVDETVWVHGEDGCLGWNEGCRRDPPLPWRTAVTDCPGAYDDGCGSPAVALVVRGSAGEVGVASGHAEAVDDYWVATRRVFQEVEACNAECKDEGGASGAWIFLRR